MEAVRAVPFSRTTTAREVYTEDARERARRRVAAMLELPPPAPRWPDGVVIGLDALGLVLGFIGAAALTRASAQSVSLWHPWAVLLGGVLVGVHLLALNHAALYRSHIHRTALEQFPQIVLGATYGAVIDLAVSSVSSVAVPSQLIALTWVVSVVVVTAGRSTSSRIRRAALRRSPGGSATIVVGSGPLAHRLVEEIQSHPEEGLRLVGYVEDGSGGEAPGGLRRFGELEDLPLVVTTLEIGDVLVAGAPERSEILTGAVRSCARTEARMSLVAPHPDLMLPFGEHDRIGSLPLIQLVHPQHRPVAHRARDAVDWFVSTVILVAVAPLIGALALIVKLDSPGPAFFRQRRVGRGGAAFDVIKLRTMVADAESRKAGLMDQNEADGPLFKMRNDPRVTRVGRFLRKTSLDELPQLWNVVRGEMSLVGPRPALQDEVLRYPFWFRRRLSVKPGVTGLWQVNGRSQLSFTDAMRLDLSYVEGWSPWLDIQILIRTIGVVLFRRGGA